MKEAESAAAAAVTFGILFGVFAFILVIVLVIMFCKPSILHLEATKKNNETVKNTKPADEKPADDNKEKPENQSWD